MSSIKSVILTLGWENRKIKKQASVKSNVTQQLISTHGIQKLDYLVVSCLSSRRLGDA